MAEDEWNRYASNLFKTEMASAGDGYDDLIKRLAEVGVQEDFNSLVAKIHRCIKDDGVLTAIRQLVGEVAP